MLAGYALANPIEVFLNELPVTKENAGSFHRRRFPPRRKRRRGGLDRFVHNIRAAHRHFGNDFAAGRIVDGRKREVIWLAPLAVDESRTGDHGKTPSSKLQ